MRLSDAELADITDDVERANFLRRSRNSYPYGYSTLRQDGLLWAPFHVLQGICFAWVLIFSWSIFAAVVYGLWQIDPKIAIVLGAAIWFYYIRKH